MCVCVCVCVCVCDNNFFTEEGHPLNSTKNTIENPCGS